MQLAGAATLYQIYLHCMLLMGATLVSAKSEILVYSDGGEGASPDCVEMAILSLRDTVSRYDLQHTVRTTTSKELVGSTWRDTCQLLVMPGGCDLPYCEELDGQGNQQIKTFVEEGGSYLGICAGGYYGAAYVEFDKGDPKMEVVGPRELAFFPVTAEGPVFAGFSYRVNKGAYAAGATVTQSGSELLGLSEHTCSLYYNGGCDFAFRKTLTSDPSDVPYKVLVTYTGKSEPRPPSPSPHLLSNVAVIGGNVGRGKVILTGLHFEASASLLEKFSPDDEYVTKLLPTLKSSEQQRELIFDACARYLLNSL